MSARTTCRLSRSRSRWTSRTPPGSAARSPGQSRNPTHVKFGILHARRSCRTANLKAADSNAPPVEGTKVTHVNCPKEQQLHTSDNVALLFSHQQRQTI